MKVVVLANDFQPPWDEAGKNNAAEIVRRLAVRHEVTVMGLGAVSSCERIEGVTIERFASPGYRGPWKRLLYLAGYARLLATGSRRLRSLRPDRIISFWETASTGLLAHLLRKLGWGHAELYQVVWTDTYFLAPAPPWVWLREHLPNLVFNNRFLTSLGVRYCDRVFATSHYLGRRLTSAGALDVRIGLHGVDIERFRPGPALTDVCRPPSVIGYLGHATHAKGLDVLLDAVSPLLVEGQRELWLALSDSQEAAELGARRLPGVRFYGLVPPEAFFNSCDVVVFPRIASYGTASYPNALLEAMACGRCVVTTRQPGIDEIVQDGVTGCLVSPGDGSGLRACIEELLADDPRRRQLGEAARRFVASELAWERVLAPLEESLEPASGTGTDRIERTEASSRTRVVVAREHVALRQVLLAQGRRQLSLLHVDDHCDMRGWIVDAKAQRGRWLGQQPPPDSGNVLAHLAHEGVAARIHWCHGSDGGRLQDIGTYLEPSEAEQWPWRLMESTLREPWCPLVYGESAALPGPGDRAFDVWSLDWDFFAPFPARDAVTARRVDDFLQWCAGVDRPPRLVFLCSSPGYSSAHVGTFDRLVERLRLALDARVEYLEDPWGGAFGKGPAGRAATLGRFGARQLMIRAKRAWLRLPGPGSTRPNRTC